MCACCSWEPIEEYIEGAFAKYEAEETKISRSDIRDCRVHCCLYFLTPCTHGVRPLDIEVMKRLSTKVCPCCIHCARARTDGTGGRVGRREQTDRHAHAHAHTHTHTHTHMHTHTHTHTHMHMHMHMHMYMHMSMQMYTHMRT